MRTNAQLEAFASSPSGAQLMASIARAEISSKAIAITRKIVDRVLPLERAPHGFYEFDAFIEASKRHGRRTQLAREVLPRIHAKLIRRAGL